jgi:Leucine-rich repeat (LRR) protein
LTYIDLQSNGLTGTIPTELGLLTGLMNLELPFNELTGTIPTELGLLTALTFLDLEVNALTGIIPSELGMLIPSTCIWLRSNDLSGNIPEELDDLKCGQLGKFTQPLVLDYTDLYGLQCLNLLTSFKLLLALVQRVTVVDFGLDGKF